MPNGGMIESVAFASDSANAAQAGVPGALAAGSRQLAQGPASSIRASSPSPTRSKARSNSVRMPRAGSIALGLPLGARSCRCCARARPSACLAILRAATGAVRRDRDFARRDLRRPGGDRDPERAAVQRDAQEARAGRREGRQRGQELVPRHDEPRDPHADERGDRHERPAARHARSTPSSTTTPPPSATRATRCSRSSTTSSTSRRSRPGAWTSRRSRSTCASASSRRSTSSRARAVEKHLDIAYVFEGDVPRGDRRRRDAAAPDPAQPAVQRGEVHRATARSCSRVTAQAARGRARRAHVRRARHRHRPLRRRHEPPVPVVLAGRLVDDAQVRRHRPRPGDQQAPRRADGRAHVGARATGPGKGSTFSFTIEAPIADAAAGPAARLRRRAARAAGQARARRRRQRHQPPRARAADRKWGMDVARHRIAARSAALARSRARRSTSRSSTCTCRRWTASRWRGGSASAGPTLPLVLFSSLGRREAGDAEGLFDAYLAQADPPVAAVRHAGRPARARGGAQGRRGAGQAAARPRAWRRAIRCASCWPRTTS